jgi:4,5-dihydroxyphthalate decarboxylase
VATELEIPITWMRYDVTMPLIDGRVTVDGVRLVPSRSAPNGTIIGPDNPIPRGDFGLVDMNMGNWLTGIEAGWEIAPLPVFPKRKHVYTYLFCRADAGIEQPKDLEGKRVLSTIGGSAVAIWLKALLAQRHGVDLARVTWVTGREQWPQHRPDWTVEQLPGRKSVVDALLDGDADATMLDVSDRQLWQSLETHPKIKRLFPDYLGETRRYFEESGIYTPVHMMVLSKKIDRDYPELAGKLCAAFEQAKRVALDDVLDDRAGFSLIDLRERTLAQEKAWSDVFAHGLAANKAAIDTFAAHCHEHGVIDRIHPYDEIFASSTLNT